MLVEPMDATASRRMKQAGILIALVAAAAAIVMTRLPSDPAAGPAVAAHQDFGAVPRYVFVPSRSTSIVTVVERDSDRVVGAVDAGEVPAQIFVSESTGKLAVIAAAGHQVSVVDLKNGQRGSIDLDFVPQRLLGSVDGNLVAAADLASGTIAFLELVREREVSRISGLPPIRDLMFGADGAFLYVAADGLKGIGVVDIARGKLIEEIPTYGAAPGDVSGLTRSPSGRLGYAKARNERSISVLDLSNFRPVRQLEVGHAAGKVFPTGFGGYLVVPDNAERTVTIVANSSMTVAAMLEGASEMTTVYSGWFDTLALLPSRAERKLLVYDLDRLTKAGEIPLPALPGPGAVTPEGTKLYLAMEGTKQVAVIDLQARRLMKSIGVGFEPLAAIMARSFDVCH
jgi:DNA-binding beta-propeller fold protein YncE